MLRNNGGKFFPNDISMVARTPVTDLLPEIANHQQTGAGNDNPRKAQGHQQS